MKIIQFKNYALYIIFLLAIQSVCFAQRLYENGVVIICPCEISKFIQENQRGDFAKPFIVSPNCGTSRELQKTSERQSITTAPEGFYLFGHRKKKQKPMYPKTTNAIQF